MTGGHRPPEASIWPVALALGVSLAAAGVVTHWLVAVSGALVTAAAGVGWVADLLRGDG